MAERITVFAVLALAMVLFVRARWRYDVVALLALLVLTLAGIVPASEAFAGFGHPAVITVGAILVVSRGLAASGAVDLISRKLLRPDAGVGTQVAWLTAAVTLCSAFMNNVGA
ncbi:MAG: SLC13 family permease, partial [Acidobacteria bacterium]|nr:SLC13 family permease [Acidobacteriota bacterium]